MKSNGNSHDLPDNDREFIVALAGNPNAGKTTLFNELTGIRQKVANYPGVTVEFKEAKWHIEETSVNLIDLPGLYSIDADSPDEEIARDVLTGKIENLSKPDAVVAVVDATNLERNLYLVSQLIEYEIPLVIALTMFDDAEKEEIEIDVEKLSKLLKVPVVPVTAITGRGISELEKQVLMVLEDPPKSFIFQRGEEAGKRKIFERYNRISEIVQDSVSEKKYVEGNVTEKIDRILTHKIFGLPILIALVLLVFVTIFSLAALPMDILDNSFGLFGKFIEDSLPDTLFTKMLTGGVVSGVGAVLVFVPQIFLLFLFISILEDVGYMARAAFLLDHLMSKVGLNGRAFLPLFSSHACAIPGIMATRTIGDPKDRLATILIAPFMSCSARLPIYFLMIPVFLGSSSVSGALLVLAMYFIGIITALIIAFLLKRFILKTPSPPLMIELPPYRKPRFGNVLLNVWQNVWMFIKRAGTVIFALSILLWWLQAFPLPEEEYKNISTTEIVLSVILVFLIISLGIKWLLKTFVSKRVSIIARKSDAKKKSLWSSLQSSTSIGLVIIILIFAWAAAAYVPFSTTQEVGADEITESEKLEKKKVQVENSYAGWLGKTMEPVFRPLGFDDKMTFGVIASFAAREVFVSALKIISTGGEDEPESIGDVWGKYWEDVGTFWVNVSSLNFNDVFFREDTENKPLVEGYSPLTALSAMIFFVLAMQCMSTLAIVWRETNSWKYPVIMFGYMTVLAYVVALLTFQGGSLLLQIFGKS